MSELKYFLDKEGLELYHSNLKSKYHKIIELNGEIFGEDIGPYTLDLIINYKEDELHYENFNAFISDIIDGDSYFLLWMNNLFYSSPSYIVDSENNILSLSFDYFFITDRSQRVIITMQEQENNLIQVDYEVFVPGNGTDVEYATENDIIYLEDEQDNNTINT